MKEAEKEDEYEACWDEEGGVYGEDGEMGRVRWIRWMRKKRG